MPSQPFSFYHLEENCRACNMEEPIANTFEIVIYGGHFQADGGQAFPFIILLTSRFENFQLAKELEGAPW